MASNTPRQRQYAAAITAQLHNLSGNLLPTLLAAAVVTLPVGQSLQPNPVRPAYQYRAALTDASDAALGPTLYNLTANVPPDGRATDPNPVVRAYPYRATLTNATDSTLQPTLYNLTANTLPVGEAALPEPVRPTFIQRAVYAQAAAVPLALVSDLPPGESSTALPVRPVYPYRATLTQPTDALGNQTTLLNEGANTPPNGESSTALPNRARPGLTPVDPPNLLTGVLLPLPDGRGWQDAPNRQPGRPGLLDPLNLLVGTLAGTSLPPGAALLTPAPRSAPRPVVFDQPNLLDGGTLTLSPLMPVGVQSVAMPVRAKRLPVWFDPLNLLGVIPPPAAVEVIDLWADLREGDYIRLVSPYTAPGGECPIARIMSRSFRDGDPFVTLELQYIDPIDVNTPLRLIGDLGTMAPPPPIVAQQTDVTHVIAVLRGEVEKLQTQMASLQPDIR